MVELPRGGRVAILVPVDFPASPLRAFAIPRGAPGARELPALAGLAPDLWLRAVARGEEVIDALAS